MFWSVGYGIRNNIYRNDTYISTRYGIIFLFGNIFISQARLDIIAMAVMTVIIVFITIVLFNDWKTFLFDPEFCKIKRNKTTF